MTNPIILCAALVAGFALSSTGAEQKVWSDAEVMAVHRKILLVDGHNDVPMKTREGLDIGKRAAAGHTDLPRMRAGGMGAQFFAAFVPASAVESRTAARTLFAAIDTIRHDIIGRYPHEFALALTAAEIEAAWRAGKIASLIAVEGGHAIEDDLRLLRAAYDLGARYMTLTHVNTNNWADSSGDLDRPGVRHHNGLTAFGREVIAEMNRLGMMVDIAHVSDKTFWDVLETSRAPVFSSHSSVRALCNHPRNLSDEMIRALAVRGGVVMINFSCDYLSQRNLDASPDRNPEYRSRREQILSSVTDPADRRAALRNLYNEYSRLAPRATIDDVVAHIDHVKRLVGADFVGLGSDFDGISCTPEGLEDVSRWPNLTRKLLERGYSVEEITKIYGGNLLRFMREVEATAARLQQGG